MIRQPNWIWIESPGEPFDYYYARREFDAASITEAEAHVCCPADYALYANGRYAGRGAAAESLFYNTHDLSHIIRPGKNVIGAVCRRSAKGQSGFILQLALHQNGKQQILVTDSSWKMQAGREWASVANGGMNEVCDSSLRPIGWNVVGFDDGDWDQASIIREHKPWDSIMPRDIPLPQETEVHPARVINCGSVLSPDGNPLIASESVRSDPKRVKYAKEMLAASGNAALVGNGEDAFIVLDFGQRIVGRFALKIRDAGQATIDICYGEILGADRLVNLSHHQPDRLILHGGRQSWHTFGRRAFRYVQLYMRNLDKPVSIESAYAIRTGYPVECAASFECSDTQLSEIWTGAVGTLQLHMHDSYEANPLLDPASRPASARLQALANYHCFSDHALAAKTLAEFAEFCDIDDSWISMMYEYALYTSDISLPRQHYNEIKKRLEQGSSRHSFQDASKLARMLSNFDDAMEWHTRANENAKPADPEFSLRGLQQLFNKNDAKYAADLIRFRWEQTVASQTDPWWSAPAGDEDYAAAFCLPIYFLSSEVLGIKPYTFSNQILVQPRPGGLKWAKGRALSCDTHWRFEDEVFLLDIDTPNDFIVALPIDGFRNPRIDEIDLTPETPERRARKTYGWGSTIWRDNEERDPYLDWLETQEARPPAGHQPKQRCRDDKYYIWIREPVSHHVRYEIRDETDG